MWRSHFAVRTIEGSLPLTTIRKFRHAGLRAVVGVGCQRREGFAGDSSRAWMAYGHKARLRGLDREIWDVASSHDVARLGITEGALVWGYAVLSAALSASDKAIGANLARHRPECTRQTGRVAQCLLEGVAWVDVPYRQMRA